MFVLGLCVCGCVVYGVCVSRSVFVSIRELLTYSNSISSFQFVFTAHITVCMYKCLLHLQRYIRPKYLHIHPKKHDALPVG